MSIVLAEFQLGPFALEHPSGLFATIVGLVLLVVLAKPLGKFLGLPQPSVVLADRSRQIETDTLQVERQMQDIAQLRNDYANRIQTIEKEQRDRIAAAVRDADNARADILAEAEETSRALRRRGEEEMERERTRQRILLRQHMVQTTLNAAESAIKAQNSDAMQRQLIRDFTANVAAHRDGLQPSAAPIAPPVLPTQGNISAPAAVSAPHSAPAIPAPLPTSGGTSSGAVVYDTPNPAVVTESNAALPDFNAFNTVIDHSAEKGEA